MEWPTVASIIGTTIAILGVVLSAVKAAEERGRMKQRQDEVEGDVNHIGKKVRGVEERLRNTEQAIAGLSEKIEAVDDKVDTANGKLDTIIGWHAQGHA